MPKVYVVLGLGALYFFLIFFNIAGEFLVNTAGFVIPAYYSLQALFSASKADDTQWLTVSWTNACFELLFADTLPAVLGHLRLPHRR